MNYTLRINRRKTIVIARGIPLFSLLAGLFFIDQAVTNENWVYVYFVFMVFVFGFLMWMQANRKMGRQGWTSTLLLTALGPAGALILLGCFIYFSIEEKLRDRGKI